MNDEQRKAVTAAEAALETARRDPDPATRIRAVRDSLATKLGTMPAVDHNGNPIKEA